MEETNESSNPLLWLRTFFKPRSTIRYAIDHTSMKYATWLAVLLGVTTLISELTVTSILLSVVFGSLIGLFMWLLSYKLNYHIGKWMGGTGTKKEMKIATAWAFIPSLVGFVLIYLPMIILYGNSSFYYGNFDYPVQMIILYIGELIGIWSFFISIIAISEAHKLSIWKSILVCILPAVILFLIAGVVSLV